MFDVGDRALPLRDVDRYLAPFPIGTRADSSRPDPSLGSPPSPSTSCSLLPASFAQSTLFGFLEAQAVCFVLASDRHHD